MSASKDFNKHNRHGTNALFKAIEKGDAEKVKKMLMAGADVNAQTKFPNFFSYIAYSAAYEVGSTPLHAAAMHGDTEIISLLLDFKADPNAKNLSGHTPLDEALQSYFYYDRKLTEKERSNIKTVSAMSKAEKKNENAVAVVNLLIFRGAKPGFFALPEAFTRKPETKPLIP